MIAQYWIPKNFPDTTGQWLPPHHHVMAPSSLFISVKYLEDTCPDNRERNKILVFTNLFTFALNHCTWKTQHVAKSYFFHYSVWHGELKGVLFFFQLQKVNIHHLWHFSVPRYCAPASHHTLDHLRQLSMLRKHGFSFNIKLCKPWLRG